MIYLIINATAPTEVYSNQYIEGVLHFKVFLNYIRFR